MKNILLLSLAGLLLTLSLSSRLTNAQELTRSDVEAVTPQLVNLLSSLNTNISHIRARIATENALFKEYSNLLGTLSLRLNQTPVPSAAELQNLERTIAEMRRLASLSASWRADVEARMSNIAQILGNISALISQATGSAPTSSPATTVPATSVPAPSAPAPTTPSSSY